MAPSVGTLRVGRYFAVLLGLFVVLYGIVFWPHQPRTPKLGLDLQGGAQVILKAQTTNGKAPSKAALDQARQIITNRVNGLGVSSAEVHATYAGDDPERFLRLFALPVELYFPAAGAVPLVVGGAAAGVLAVSGLSGEEDHDLAVDALRGLGQPA